MSNELNYDFEHEEPIIIHKLPSSDKSEYDYCFSNGRQYRHQCDRRSIVDYYEGFSDRDKLLDDAITRGNDLHCDTNLWRIYDDAVLNYGLEPINPYEWLFKHATLGDKSVIISDKSNRLLIVHFAVSIRYYDFIHGECKYFARYARPVDN